MPDAAQVLLGSGGVLATDPTQNMQLAKNPVTGMLEPHMLYNRKTETLPDNTTRHQITIDAHGGIEEVRRVLAREISRAKEENPSVTIPTEAELDRAAEECVENVQAIDGPEVHYELKIDIAEFRRGIIKIAYELAFIWLGESYLDDPIAVKLRTVLLEGTDPAAIGVHGHFEFGSSIEPLRPWANEADTHVAFNAIMDGKMAVCIKIFNEVSGVVVVSDEPYKYCRGQFDPGVVRFIRINAASGVERQSSYIDECGRIASKILRSPQRKSDATSAS